MPSSDSKAPFEKFSVKMSPLDERDFIVSVRGAVNTAYGPMMERERRKADLQRARQQFIEVAIRERLERERKP